MPYIFLAIPNACSTSFPCCCVIHYMYDDVYTFITWKYVVYEKFVFDLTTSLRGVSQLTHTAISWWRHQMQTVSALLAIYAGNSPVPGEFPAQRPVPRDFDVFFDLRPDQRLSKQSWGWWFEMPSHSLWRHRTVTRSTVVPNKYRFHCLSISY